jgi:hypothetical protein
LHRNQAVGCRTTQPQWKTQPCRQHFGLSPAAKVLDLKGRLVCRGCRRKGRAVVCIEWGRTAA